MRAAAGHQRSGPVSGSAPQGQADFQPLRDAEWAAGILAINKARVYQLSREGVLPCVRLGRQIRFDERTIRAWVEAGGQGLPVDSAL